MDIELETLSLRRYDESRHEFLKKEFYNGNSSSEYIHDISERLVLSKDNDRSIYQSAFVVEDEEVPVGYLFISSMIRDEVFLEYAVLKDFRRRGYASRIVNETTDYLFKEHNIRSVRLDIDSSNKNSVFVADACGFTVDEEEYESRNFIGKMQFVKESDSYISKRRKV